MLLTSSARRRRRGRAAWVRRTGVLLAAGLAMAPLSATAATASASPHPHHHGDASLTKVTSPPAAKGPEGSTGPARSVQGPRLVIEKKTGSVTPGPGEPIFYTVTVHNTSATDYTGATYTDDLSGVLDDATYNGDAKADNGTVTYGEPTLTWTGDVESGTATTILYSVTVDTPDLGDRKFTNTINGPADSNCAAGSSDPKCMVSLSSAPFDFGDAPDSYGTTLANDGAHHRIIDGLRIGDAVDDELDGTPSEDADADAGEDGIEPPLTLIEGDGDVEVTVPVTNSYLGPVGPDAVLAGWIDADGSGTFDAGEKAEAKVPGSATEATLTWSGLDHTKPGRTYLRLRLFGVTPEAPRALAQGTIGPIEPAGYGGLGEVEDHTVEVKPLVPPPPDKDK